MAIKIPRQEVFLDAFSSNSYDNINKLNYWFSATTQTKKDIGGGSYLPDFSSLLVQKPVVCPFANSFEVSNPSGLNISVGRGKAFINGVFVEINEETSLNVSTLSDYLFDTEEIPSSNTFLYLSLFYDPAESEEVTLGFFESNIRYVMHENSLCILAIIGVSCSGGVPSSISEIRFEHPTYLTRCRRIPEIILDGGKL